LKTATIHITAKVATIRGVSHTTLNRIDRLLSVPNPAAEHVKRRAASRCKACKTQIREQTGRWPSFLRQCLSQCTCWACRWDGTQHLFNMDMSTFPVGLVHLVKRKLKKQYTVRVVDERVMNVDKVLKRVDTRMLPGRAPDGRRVVLRDYQVESLRRAIKSRGGVFHLATNAGKTPTAAGLINALRTTTLYLVPNAKLLKQTRTELAAYLKVPVDEIGVIGSGQFEVRKLTVAMASSLTYKPNGKATAATRAKYKLKAAEIRSFLSGVKAVILDEVHHAAAKTWRTVVDLCTRAVWRFGLSGTPFDRTDGNSIYVMAYCGPAVARVSNDYLIKKGFSARPKITAHIVKKVIDADGNRVYDLGHRYTDVYKAGIVRNVAFHEKVVRDSLRHVRAKRKVLVLLRELEHGHAQLQAFENAGFGRAEFVHGKMSGDEVEEAKERFSRGDVRVLIGSPVLGEGQNMPDIGALIVADDFVSIITTLQRIGRGLRKKKGANVLRVEEYAHMSHHFFAEHFIARCATYEAEGFTVRDAA